MEEKLDEAKVEQFKQEKDEMNKKKFTLNEEEKEAIKKIFEEAKQPTVLKDGDVTCGEGELDIRELSKKNRDQMFYRAEMLDIVYLRYLVTGIIDITKLLMVALKQLGVADINKALDDLGAELKSEFKR